MCKANGTKEANATKADEGATDARKKLLFIVGSLRAGSFNRVLADYAAHVVGDRAQVDYLDYSDVPFMDEDIEFPAPASVERVRRQVDEADGVWIFTPEYNFSYPAALKNVLDWLSRPQVAGDHDAAVSLTDMPVAISGAGGKNACASVRRQLVDLLNYVEATVVGGEGEGFVLPAAAWTEGVYEAPEWDKTRIAMQAEDLLATVGSLSRSRSRSRFC